MNATLKCAHPACNCVPAEGKEFCSEVCRDAKGITELACQCQHSVCQGQALKP
jgi:hypothetical protein